MQYYNYIPGNNNHVVYIPGNIILVYTHRGQALGATMLGQALGATMLGQALGAVLGQAKVYICTALWWLVHDQYRGQVQTMGFLLGGLSLSGVYLYLQTINGILSELVGTSMFSEYIRPHPPACSVSTYAPLLYHRNTVRSCHGGTVLHSRRI